MEIIKFPLSYLTSTKYITRDIVIKEQDKAYTSGTVIVSQGKLLIIEGLITCL
jgi:hypothetical protein